MKTIFLFLALVVGTISPVVESGGKVSQAEIRKLVERGELLSLESILLLYPEEEYGKLLDLEVEYDDGRIIYEMEFLRADGQIIEIEVDARDGQMLEQEIKD